MAENKIVFSFDVKGQENLARALSEMQKQTQGLGDDVKRLADRSAQDLDTMLKAFQKLSGSKSILDEIKGGLGELDKALLDSATKSTTKVLEQGFLEKFKQIKSRFETLKNETALIARDISEMEQKGDVSGAKAKAASYVAAVEQVGILKSTVDQLSNLIKFDDKGEAIGIDYEKFGEAVVSALKKAAVARPGAGGGKDGDGKDGDGKDGDGEGGGSILNTMAGLFGVGGPIGQILKTMGPAGIAAATVLGLDNLFNSIGSEQSRSATFIQDSDPARRAISGDVGTMLRRMKRQSSYDLFGAGRGSLVDVISFGLKAIYGALTTEEGGYEYARARTRAELEERDRTIFKDLDMGARIAFNDSESNLLTARGYGEEANRKAIQRLRQEGLTEAQSREFRQYMAMYRGSMEMGGAEVGLAMADRQLGMTPFLQGQILRSTQTGSTAGLSDFLSLLGMAGMTDASSIYGRQILSNYIGKQMDIYGPGSTVAGAGGFAAGTIQELQKNMPGLSSFDAAKFGVQGADIASRHMETQGSLINTIQIARLAAMNFGPDAIAMAQARGLHNADTRKQLLEYAKRKGLNVTEDELNKALSESGQSALNIVKNVLSPETEAAFPGAAGTILSGDKSIAGGIAVESAYRLGGAPGQATGQTVKATEETLADIMSSRQAKFEAESTRLAGTLEEFKTSVEGSLREIINSMHKQDLDREKAAKQRQLRFESSDKISHINPHITVKPDHEIEYGVYGPPEPDEIR
jgi:hypothetical protein